MRATARVRAGLDARGASTLLHLSGQPPVVPRATGASRVHLVGAAAGPLTGDATSLRLDIGPGATLVVGQAGATLAMPAARPDLPASTHRVCAEVGARATLVVVGQPLVAVAGAWHELTVEIALGAGSRLVWLDRLVCGRSDEPSGSVTTRLDVRRSDGTTVLATGLAVGPTALGWADGALLGGARCAGTLLVAGCGTAPTSRYAGRAALVPLAAGDARLATALGEPHEVERLLALALADALADHPELLALSRSA